MRNSAQYMPQNAQQNTPNYNAINLDNQHQRRHGPQYPSNGVTLPGGDSAQVPMQNTSQQKFALNAQQTTFNPNQVRNNLLKMKVEQILAVSSEILLLWHNLVISGKLHPGEELLQVYVASYIVNFAFHSSSKLKWIANFTNQGLALDFKGT